MDDWPLEKKLVRKAVCLMAMKRGILYASKVIKPIRVEFANVQWDQLQLELENRLYQVRVMLRSFRSLPTTLYTLASSPLHGHNTTQRTLPNLVCLPHPARWYASRLHLA